MTQKYENPRATVDLIVETNNQVLLVERLHDPYQGMWALPGGFLNCGRENLEQAGVRELQEETGLRAQPRDLVLIGVYSDPNRDPRGHVIAHTYIVTKWTGQARAGDDAAKIRFFPLDNLPDLAFDHNQAIKDYLIWKKK